MLKHLFRYLSILTIPIFPTIAQAQTYQPSNRIPVADNTIGTQVAGSGNNFTITGGLNRGQTLFHSFSDFSVPTGGAANFSNPPSTQSIISRVTGNLFSDINGLVNSNGANLLLINPNGIVFGPNAQLNVGRAFMASTANGVNLVDGSGRGIVFGTNSKGDAPLLTIAPDVFFNVSSLSMGGGNGAINNFGTLQTSNPSQYIGLIGGNVTMNGGKVLAPGGRVDLGGLITTGTVSVDRDGLIFGGSGLVRGNVSISNRSIVDVSATQILEPVDAVFFKNAIAPASSINIFGNQIDVLNTGTKFIDKNGKVDRNQQFKALEGGLAAKSGDRPGTIGNISLNATGDITLRGSSIKVEVREGSKGVGGDIKIRSDRNLTLTDSSGLSTNLSKDAAGSAGNIDIKTKGNVSLVDSVIPDIKAKIDDAFSVITSSTYGQGNAGKVKIETEGKLAVGNNNSITSTVESSGEGNSGGIQIIAKELELFNKANILTFADPNTPGTPGDAGPIDIQTTGNITISGYQDARELNPNARFAITQISSNSFRNGNPGKISISTPGKLSIVNQGAISSEIRQRANGNSGAIEINVGQLEILNQSRIISNTAAGGSGNAGNINIKVKGNLKIDGTEKIDLAQKNDPKSLSYISSSTKGQGNGGKIEIDAGGNISISNRGGILTDSTSTTVGNSGGDIIINSNRIDLDRSKISLDAANDSGGNITLNTQYWMLMRNNSLVSTNSGSKQPNGNGGNILIDSPLIIALPGNNDITTNANRGNGGLVNITSQGLFGIQYRPKGQEAEFTSDITSSSILGEDGKVNIKTPGIDPGQNLTELPNNTTDDNTKLSQICSESTRQNKFFITGRGGLPLNAYEPLSSDEVWLDPRNPNSSKAARIATTNPTQLPSPAVGWVFDGKGKVKLISAKTAGFSGMTRVVCPK